MLYKKDGLILCKAYHDCWDRGKLIRQECILSIMENKYRDFDEKEHSKLKLLKPTNTSSKEIHRHLDKANKLIEEEKSYEEDIDYNLIELLEQSQVELNKMLFECEKLEEKNANNNTQLQLGLLMDNLKKQSENIETLSSSMVYLVQLLNGKVENNKNE
jgi:hypothetical protein